MFSILGIHQETQKNIAPVLKRTEHDDWSKSIIEIIWSMLFPAKSPGKETLAITAPSPNRMLQICVARCIKHWKWQQIAPEKILQAYRVSNILLSRNAKWFQAVLWQIRSDPRQNLTAIQSMTCHDECRLLIVTPCGSCENRRFGGTYRLYHQGDKNRRARNVSSN
jgi:hypothetical protein